MKIKWTMWLDCVAKEMNWDKEYIEQALEDALESLVRDVGKITTARIRSLVYTNLERGRIDFFLNGRDDYLPRDYVWRVLEVYQRLHPYLHKVQMLRSEDVWFPLYNKLQTWAYNYLLSRRFTPGPETSRLAVDYASDASAALLTAYFPYDTEFDPWAVVLVCNVAKRNIRRALKKSTIPKDKMTDLEEWLNSVRPRPHALEDFVKEQQMVLLEAIMQLTEEQRQLILLRYYKGFSLSEAAQQMGKEANAIYSLHFRALQKLRKILGRNGDNK